MVAARLVLNVEEPRAGCLAGGPRRVWRWSAGQQAGHLPAEQHAGEVGVGGGDDQHEGGVGDPDVAGPWSMGCDLSARRCGYRCKASTSGASVT